MRKRKSEKQKKVKKKKVEKEKETKSEKDTGARKVVGIYSGKVILYKILEFKPTTQAKFKSLVIVDILFVFVFNLYTLVYE